MRIVTVGSVLVALAFSASIACAQRTLKNAAQHPRSLVQSSAARTVDSTMAVRQFVQAFYDRYLAFLQTESRFPDWWHVLSSTPGDLDANLARALRADSVASRTEPATRELIGFDPFLESQDPCPRYAVTDVRSDAAGYRVTMRPVCPNAESQKWQTARPVVEVIPEAGHWKIANVFYEKGNLRSLLCGFAKADKRVELRPAKCY